MTNPISPQDARQAARREDARIERVEFHVDCPGGPGEPAVPIGDIAEQASAWGCKALGFVARGGLQSLIAAGRDAQRFGIKPIFGVRFTARQADGSLFEGCAYALNELGKKNLFRIVSLALSGADGGMEAVPAEMLESLRGGLVISGGHAGSALFHAALQGSREDAEAIARRCDVLEIRPYGLSGVAEDGFSAAQWERAVRLICEIGDKLRIPVIASGYGGERGEAPSLRTADELLQAFAFLGADKAREVVVANTNRLADRFEAYGMPTGRPYTPPFVDGGDRHLRLLCCEAAITRYGHPLPETILKRLEWELDAIVTNGFAAPYLIARQAVLASQADGYPVSTRGSVGSSAAAYFLGISEVNPLPPHYVCRTCTHSEWPASGTAAGSGFDLPDKACPRCGKTMKGDGHNIPGEMFLGLDGSKVPNIDLNFASEYKPVIHDHMRAGFGERVLRAGVVGGGQHPGGLYFIPRELEAEDFTPIEYAGTNGHAAAWRKTHFDCRELDKHLFRLDLLASDDLSIMRRLHRLTGVDPAKVPMNDPKVLGLFRSTGELGIPPQRLRYAVGTCGIPEMGVPFVRSMLERTQPSTFFDLLQISGLSHGTGTWEGNAEEMIASGLGTLETVPALRDDLMLKLMDYGLDLDTAHAIADSVRRGKGVEPWTGTMRAFGVPEWYIASCSRIQYMFPKAHAAVYVMLAVRHAYYKLYHPLAYYAVYFTVRGTNVDIDLCCDGHEAIEQRLAGADAENRAGSDPSGDPRDLALLEVALEMTARGYRFRKGTASDRASLYIVGPDGEIGVPAGE